MSATHILGGYLSYTTGSDLKCKITVRLLSDGDAEMFEELGRFDFGDGTSFEEEFDFTIEHQNEKYKVLRFDITHTFPGPGDYNVVYANSNYNSTIVNLLNAENKEFRLSAHVLILSSIGTNRSPVLKLFNLQKGMSNVAQRINPAPYDADNDSLSYNLINPGLNDYNFPNNEKFYENHNTGSGTNNGKPVYTIDPLTGEILWDVPETQGEYVITYKITQWRKIEGTWVVVGENVVVLLDRISESDKELLISSPQSQCFDTEREVLGQFSINGPSDEKITVKAFSNIEGGLINEMLMEPNQILNFDSIGSLQLKVTLPDDQLLEPYKPYRVVLYVQSGSETSTVSWGFAIGCDGLPGHRPPDPILNTPKSGGEELKVYLNPAYKEYIKVKFYNKKEDIKNIHIVNSSSMSIVEKSLPGNLHYVEIDISTLSPGLYFIHTDRHIRKFVVQDR